MSSTIIGLNPEQNTAVTATSNSILVLAGAGSGKTRVLTERICWLVKNGTPINHIMAVTFTNKAANEMRHRLEKSLGLTFNTMWLGTFHSLAHRFLRLHWQEANLNQNFQIIDGDDQYRLLRRIHKEMSLDEEKWPIKSSQFFISKNKDLCLRPQHVKPSTHIEATLLKIYKAYSDACQRGSLVDFSELLLRVYEVLQEQPLLLQQYKQRFHHILIDEFQDTNSLQYLWIKALAQGSANLMAVGDDDQSIYGWRGANVENMEHLRRDFPDTQIIRLEQNYRSTSVILQAANAVIANNHNRLGKNLWTSGAAGDLITLYAAYNEMDEAKYVVDKIYAKKNTFKIKRLSEVAILYRSNAQSRSFEEQLIQAQIPYRIHGGLRFFERAEIKDALAYLRILINPHDDAALERIINVPTRGIGETTLILLRNYAHEHQISLFASLQEMIAKGMVATRTATALNNFLNLQQHLQAKIVQVELYELVAEVIKASGLFEYFAKDKSEKSLMRTDNLEELVNATKQFALNNGDIDDGKTNIDLLTAFLANAALEAGEAMPATATEDCVQLMTLHAAKGLEFNTVFLCGLEEGLFPHQMSMGTQEEQEEERRLCYVGITRARFNLYCTYAESRQWYGTTSLRQPSRFLREIPAELMQEDTTITAHPTSSYENYGSYNSSNKRAVKTDKNFSSYGYTRSATARIDTDALSAKRSSLRASSLASTAEPRECLGFKMGQRIKHQKFGEGIIVNFEGQGEHSLIQIKFSKVGVKWLSPAYAKLEKI